MNNDRHDAELQLVSILGAGKDIKYIAVFWEKLNTAGETWQACVCVCVCVCVCGGGGGGGGGMCVQNQISGD